MMQFTTLKTWIFVFIMLRLFMDGSADYFISPTAWQYLRSLGQTEAFLGIVLASYNIASIISSPAFGWFHDRFGHTKLLLVLSHFVKFLGNLVYSIPISAYCPLVGRILSGAAAASLSVIYSIAVAHTPQLYLAKAFVFMDGLYIVGTAFGPAVSSFLSFHINILGWHIDIGNSPSFILSLVYLIFFVVSLRLPNELGKPDDTMRGKMPERGVDLQSSRQTPRKGYASISTISCAMFQILISIFLFTQRLFYFPLFAQRFHLELLHVNLLFCVDSLLVVIIDISAYLLAGYISERKLMCLSFPSQIFTIAGVTLLAISWQKRSIEYAYILLAICIGGAPVSASFPLACSLIAKITDPAQISFYQGLCICLAHLGYLSSRFISGFLFSQISLLYYTLVLALFWAAGVVWMMVEYENMGIVTKS